MNSLPGASDQVARTTRAWFFLWSAAALALPALAVTLFLVRHKETSIRYKMDRLSGQYVKAVSVVESSWQALLARPLISYVGPIFDWDEGYRRIGTVPVSEIPGLSDPVVRYQLSSLHDFEAEIVEQSWTGGLSDSNRRHLGLSRPYDIALFITIRNPKISGQHVDNIFFFDRAHVLIVEVTFDHESKEAIVDTFVPGEVPHQRRLLQEWLGD
jgi:hypothetical protein